MYKRIITAATAVALISASPAQAASTETFDRSAYDAAPAVTTAGWTLSGATAGPLGGWLEISVAAVDGTIPPNGQCEPADVDAVLTVSAGETFTVHTKADVCAHVVDGSPSLFGSFDAKQMTYTGSHKKAKLIGEGFISSGRGGLPGAQGSVTLSVRW